MGFFDFITKKFAKTNGVWFNKPKKASSFDKDEFKKAFAEIAPEVYRALQQQNRGNNSVIGSNEVNAAAELYNWLSYSGTAGFDAIGIAEGGSFFQGVNPSGSWIPPATTPTGVGVIPPPPGNFGNLQVTDKEAPIAKKPKEVVVELGGNAMEFGGVR